jgi:hypothetical protein
LMISIIRNPRNNHQVYFWWYSVCWKWHWSDTRITDSTKKDTVLFSALIEGIGKIKIINLLKMNGSDTIANLIFLVKGWITYILCFFANENQSKTKIMKPKQSFLNIETLLSIQNILFWSFSFKITKNFK